MKIMKRKKILMYLNLHHADIAFIVAASMIHGVVAKTWEQDKISGLAKVSPFFIDKEFF